MPMDTMEHREPEARVIYEYTLDQAVDDGVLCRLGWVNGKPLIGTAAIVEDVPDAERQRLFAEFLSWQRDVEPTLPEEDRLFAATASNGATVWVIDDGAAITLLYPSDY
jgi:hypothetical protein